MLGCVVLRGREAMEEGRGLSHADSRRTHCREESRVQALSSVNTDPQESPGGRAV